MSHITYGTPVRAGELIDFVGHLLDANLAAEAAGRPKTPICIWGTHGIGKTQIVEQITRARGYAFVAIAPAQFEEMGDLVGMPTIEGERTVFRPPAWVPTADGPGVLLIDDANRADDRILRGIMQLLQNFELVSWRLPRGWQIVLTANPDGGDYSVTPMDDAMLTRLMHVTLEFDVRTWARWAGDAGVDPRGIDFVLTCPEAITGRRTTPRTLTQFFEAIRAIDDLKARLGLVRILADSCLDDATVAAFLTFVDHGLGELVQPAEVLAAEDFGRAVEGPVRRLAVGETLRVDILATLCTRLVHHVARLHGAGEAPDKAAMENLKRFVKLEFLPKDLRISLARDLLAIDPKAMRGLLADREIGKLIVQSKRVR